MGLSLTLAKQNNCLFTDFPDAYWVVRDVIYSTTYVSFNLICYPSREARYKDNQDMAIPELPIGSPAIRIFHPELYRWRGQFAIADIFPKGIPISPDEQMRTLYSFVKSYTGLAFNDVLEQGQEA